MTMPNNDSEKRCNEKKCSEERCGEERSALWQAWQQTYAVVMRQLEAELQADQRLSLLCYHTLHHLVHAAQGGIRLQDLATAINLSQSGLTRLLDRMAEAGLVERRPCPQDRRGLYAVITPAGVAALQQAQPVYRRVLDAHFLPHLDCATVQSLYHLIVEVDNAEIDLDARQA